MYILEGYPAFREDVLLLWHDLIEEYSFEVVQEDNSTVYLSNKFCGIYLYLGVEQRIIYHIINPKTSKNYYETYLYTFFNKSFDKTLVGGQDYPISMNEWIDYLADEDYQSICKIDLPFIKKEIVDNWKALLNGDFSFEANFIAWENWYDQYRRELDVSQCSGENFSRTLENEQYITELKKRAPLLKRMRDELPYSVFKQLKDSIQTEAQLEEWILENPDTPIHKYTSDSFIKFIEQTLTNDDDTLLEENITTPTPQVAKKQENPEEKPKLQWFSHDEKTKIWQEEMKIVGNLVSNPMEYIKRSLQNAHLTLLEQYFEDRNIFYKKTIYDGSIHYKYHTKKFTYDYEEYSGALLISRLYHVFDINIDSTYKKQFNFMYYEEMCALCNVEELEETPEQYYEKQRENQRDFYDTRDRLYDLRKEIIEFIEITYQLIQFDQYEWINLQDVPYKNQILSKYIRKIYYKENAEISVFDILFEDIYGIMEANPYYLSLQKGVLFQDSHTTLPETIHWNIINNEEACLHIYVNEVDKILISEVFPIEILDKTDHFIKVFIPESILFQLINAMDLNVLKPYYLNKNIYQIPRKKVITNEF
ncbi:MAG: hypothetical protein MUC49_11045 [Raineya sp.]|jgi:hypothetical protein|nr:hypothetical protein [Raineya sp.]